MVGSSDPSLVEIWIILGLTLLSAEAFTGSLHLLFFGLAALLTASVASLGFHWPLLQTLLFGLLCLSSGTLVHARVKKRSGEEFWLGPDSKVYLPEILEPQVTKELDYQGARWLARNAGAEALPANSWAQVIRVEGLTLLLGPSLDPPENSPHS